MSIVAHKLKGSIRTNDVLITETVDFAGLFLSKPVLQGLTNAGFERPSPIQLKAIPLGRCGLDLIVQAKSGTGKTCVFTVVALESLQVASVCVQVLVLAPTREIAQQIQEVVRSIGSDISGMKCHTFIGGLPIMQDKILSKNCHIAVGTPGRVKQLIEIGALKTGSIRLFILDEADKLLEEGDFQETINWIYSTLPSNKQMLALSATYPEYLANQLQAYMRNPTFVRLNITDPALIGIKQYHIVVPNHPLPNIVFSSKTEIILKILSSVQFQQCLIFSNMQTRAQNLQSELESRGWPTACIAGCLSQTERSHAMGLLKTFQCRILISTDLTSRGIDADKVNLVINLDVPYDHETYLHRIGRAGRFGSYGAALTIVSSGGQDKDLWAVERKCKTYIHKLPDPIPRDLVTKALVVNLDDVVSTEQIINQPDFDFKAHSSTLAHDPPANTHNSAQTNRAVLQTASVPGTAFAEAEGTSHDNLNSQNVSDLTENFSSSRDFDGQETEPCTLVQTETLDQAYQEAILANADKSNVIEENSDKRESQPTNVVINVEDDTKQQTAIEPEGQNEGYSAANPDVERNSSEEELYISCMEDSSPEKASSLHAPSCPPHKKDVPFVCAENDAPGNSSAESHDKEDLIERKTESTGTERSCSDSRECFVNALSQSILEQALRSSSGIEKATSRVFNMITRTEEPTQGIEGDSGKANQVEDGHKCSLGHGSLQHLAEEPLQGLHTEQICLEFGKESEAEIDNDKHNSTGENTLEGTAPNDIEALSTSKKEEGCEMVWAETSKEDKMHLNNGNVTSTSSPLLEANSKDIVDICPNVEVKSEEKVSNIESKGEYCVDIPVDETTTGVEAGQECLNGLRASMDGLTDSGVSLEDGVDICPISQETGLANADVLTENSYSHREVGQGDGPAKAKVVNGNEGGGTTCQLRDNVSQKDGLPSPAKITGSVPETRGDVGEATNGVSVSDKSFEEQKSDSPSTESKTSLLRGRNQRHVRSKDRRPKSFELSLFLQQMNENNEMAIGPTLESGVGSCLREVTEERSFDSDSASLSSIGQDSISELQTVSGNKGMTFSVCKELGVENEINVNITGNAQTEDGDLNLNPSFGNTQSEVDDQSLNPSFVGTGGDVGKGTQEIIDVNTADWIECTKEFSSLLIQNSTSLPRTLSSLHEDFNLNSCQNGSTDEECISLSSFVESLDRVPFQRTPKNYLQIRLAEERHAKELQKNFGEALRKAREQVEAAPEFPSPPLGQASRQANKSHSVRVDRWGKMERSRQGKGRSRPSDSLNWRKHSDNGPTERPGVASDPWRRHGVNREAKEEEEEAVTGKAEMQTESSEERARTKELSTRSVELEEPVRREKLSPLNKEQTIELSTKEEGTKQEPPKSEENTAVAKGTPSREKIKASLSKDMSAKSEDDYSKTNGRTLENIEQQLHEGVLGRINQSPTGKSCIDECKQLDDMHTFMLKKRREKKLERERLKKIACGEDEKKSAVGISTTPPNHSDEEDPIKKLATEVKHYASHNEDVDVPLLCSLPTDVSNECSTTALEMTSKSKATSRKTLLIGNVKSLDIQTDKKTDNLDLKAIESRKPNAKRDSKESGKSVRSPTTVESIKVALSQTQKKPKSENKSAAPEGRANKNKSQKFETKEVESVRVDCDQRPKKPSKSKARLAGIEVSDGSTSSSSDLTLSSTDISDVSSSELAEAGRRSHCFTNKYAHEGKPEGRAENKPEHARAQARLSTRKKRGGDCGKFEGKQRHHSSQFDNSFQSGQNILQPPSWASPYYPVDYYTFWGKNESLESASKECHHKPDQALFREKGSSSSSDSQVGSSDSDDGPVAAHFQHQHNSIQVHQSWSPYSHPAFAYPYPCWGLYPGPMLYPPHIAPCVHPAFLPAMPYQPYPTMPYPRNEWPSPAFHGYPYNNQLSMRFDPHAPKTWPPVQPSSSTTMEQAVQPMAPAEMSRLQASYMCHMSKTLTKMGRRRQSRQKADE